MKFVVGVLVLLALPPVVARHRVDSPLLLPPAAPAVRAAPQEWLGEPILPAIFRNPGTGTDDAQDEPRGLPQLPEKPEASTRPQPRTEEPSFPKGIGALEIQAWREEDDLRRIRSWVGDATLGVPLLVPQLILEGLLPRGLAVGPTTFFYKTSSTEPSSMTLVVLDQMLFHEAQFLAQVQAYAEDGLYSENLERGQRRVLRRSLMTGFRATYAMPKMTLEMILQLAEEHGVVGYALAPPVIGALLYSKGLDQKVGIGDDVRCRFKVASGEHLLRAARSSDGFPAFSFELKFCDFPVGLLASFDASERGLIPAFVGIGTTLDTVEELLSREAAGARPYEVR